MSLTRRASNADSNGLRWLPLSAETSIGSVVGLVSIGLVIGRRDGGGVAEDTEGSGN